MDEEGAEKGRVGVGVDCGGKEGGGVDQTGLSVGQQ